VYWSNWKQIIDLKDALGILYISPQCQAPTTKKPVYIFSYSKLVSPIIGCLDEQRHPSLGCG
jgi:hypothetical protein